VSIVGPSGCGKTTLLNMLAGLVKPSRGEVKIDGRPVTQVGGPDIGYMFAKDNLLPWRNVLRNVELGLEFTRDKDRHERAREYIKLVGLEGFEKHYPDQLSHGMRQRAALARTLVKAPKILLMDEPFGALDAQTRTIMQDHFLQLWDTYKSTVVFVTHDLVEAIALSDRVLVFSSRPGRIKSEYRIPFPRPRLVEDLQVDPSFQELFRAIWNDLKDEIDSTGVSES
jgi:NitT/TauT family transport system ATP-binding protein